MRYLAYALVSLTIALVAAFFAINSGLLRDYVESQARAKSGLAIQLGAMRLEPKWPLTLNIGPSQIPAPAVHLQVKGVQVVVASFSKPYDLRIQLLEPKVKLNGALSAFSTQSRSAPAEAGAGGGGVGSSAGAYRIALHIINGEFRSTDLSVLGLNLDFEQKLWMSTKTPAKLKAAARVETQYLPGSWPITLESEAFTFGDDAVKAQSIKASFAGLVAAVQGTSLLEQGRHRWIAEVKAPDLTALPQPPLEIPATNWQGAIEVRAEIIKDGKDSQWQADGQAKAHAVKAKLKWQKEKMLVDGPAELELVGRFSYRDQKFTLPELDGSVDLSAAQVSFGEILNKPGNTPLRIDASVKGSGDKMELKKIEVRLWQFDTKVTGTVSSQAPYPADLQIDIPVTSLKGLETIVLPLKRSLVRGDAAVSAHYTGPLTDPWAGVINLQKFQLKNFFADVSYDTQGSIKAHGPFSASLEAHGEIDKGVPKAFQGNGNVQLTGLALVAGPLRKEPNQELQASFNLKTEGNALQIEQLQVKGFLGEVRASGRVSEPKMPKVDLRIETKPLDLSELRLAMPDFRTLLPKGSVSGRVTMTGQMLFEKEWFNWPLNVGGELKVSLPEYAVAAAPPSAPGDVSGANAKTPAPPAIGFLPRGPLTEKLNLQLAADVGVLTKDKLVVKGVSSAGKIAQGRFSGTLSLREIFGGKINFSRIEIPLLDVSPLIQGALTLEEIVVQDALEFAKPEYKTFATGRAKGNLSFYTILPSEAKFMDELKSKGQLTFEPITLNTVKLGQILNDLIAKVPMLKLPPAKVQPMKGMVQVDYNLAAQSMTLQPLFAREEDTSELELKGKVAIATLQGDLLGNLAWAGFGIKGCFLEGNADVKGRLIVPIAIKGNLMQPQLSMVTDTATKLAGRSLECESKKLLEKVKADGGESLKKEGEKLLKGILGK